MDERSLWKTKILFKMLTSSHYPRPNKISPRIIDSENQGLWSGDGETKTNEHAKRQKHSSGILSTKLDIIPSLPEWRRPWHWLLQAKINQKSTPSNQLKSIRIHLRKRLLKFLLKLTHPTFLVSIFDIFNYFFLHTFHTLFYFFL